jgi:hypothetical protein
MFEQVKKNLKPYHTFIFRELQCKIAGANFCIKRLPS